MVIIICHLAVGLHNYISDFFFLFCVLLHFYDLILIIFFVVRVEAFKNIAATLNEDEISCVNPDETLAL